MPHSTYYIHRHNDRCQPELPGSGAQGSESDAEGDYMDLDGGHVSDVVQRSQSNHSSENQYPLPEHLAYIGQQILTIMDIEDPDEPCLHL